jgi:hypothetical protein
MADSADILWFKTQFFDRITRAVQGTPFDADMLTAIACQETGALWGAMRHDPALTPQRIVALCCGDTLDADRGRRAFPRTRADLLAVPDGAKMFDIGREALLALADHVADYRFARRNPGKFCHGYGMFQRDLQFFLTDPRYFLERRYAVFENTLEHALAELKNGLKKRGLQDRAAISDAEFCEVAICYNTGGFTPGRGLKQGHSSGGKFYGEFIRDYLAMARRVSLAGTTPGTAPPAGTTALPQAPAAVASGPCFRVETAISPLRLRSAARISIPETANVLAEMPDGHLLRAVSGTPVNGFIEGETILGGRLFRGFAAAKFLVQVAQDPATAPPSLSPPAATLAQPPGLVTSRAARASVHSLNEAAMPGRSAGDPMGLRAELGRIIAYLAPDKLAHKRYQPRDGLSFCTLYAHDYCALAGAYLPRVWWTQPALLDIAAGQAVEPRIGGTVDEMRANSLQRWLIDFGPAFGWRRAATVSDLQDHANMGGVALITARSRADGRSGHIVPVVPETAEETAQRDAEGRVTLPLQSQAGSANFRYGRGLPAWWLDARFSESAFWMHG